MSRASITGRGLGLAGIVAALAAVVPGHAPTIAQGAKAERSAQRIKAGRKYRKRFGHNARPAHAKAPGFTTNSRKRNRRRRQKQRSR